MTATVRVTAPAKINLHLEVLGQRSDGFHELAMVMQSIDLADQLDCSNSADGLIQLSCDQPGLSCGSDNLVMRAAELLRQRSGFNELGAHLHLRKRIPIGAGLAGGSSDGAAALLALNTLWGLGHTEDSLRAMAAELGSDMPFCLAGGIQLCFGRRMSGIRPGCSAVFRGGAGERSQRQCFDALGLWRVSSSQGRPLFKW